MKHRVGVDRSQTLLFPERLEDYIAPENPVRFLDAFVASLDLHRLGFDKAQCADTGRPPYDPAMLLKLYLYGYLHRVRSSRLLEAEGRRSVEVIWLTGKQTPDFKTLADFRKDNVKPLQAVARRFTLLCRKLDLFGGELLAIDGSKFAAVNARDQNFNAAKLRELIERSDARLAEYLALTQKELEQKIAALRERRDWHEELLGQLDEEQKQISVTDPDARKMPAARGAVMGYNAQVAVDAKHKLIAAAEVSRCVEQGMTPCLPKADTSANTARGLYGKSQFKYDANKDVYVCPAGAELTYRFSTDELERELKYYRASHGKTCALKSRCTRNQANRTIMREANEHLMEAMAQRMKAQPHKFKLRKTLAEHPFGTIKRWFGYTHFLLKGLAKVRCEWSLTTSAYNLKRVLNLVSFGKLMAMVG